MEIYDLIKSIRNKDDFENFLHEFSIYARDHEKELSNTRLEPFLFSMLRYCDVLERKYQNGHLPDLQTNPSWQTIAELLFAAAIRD